MGQNSTLPTGYNLLQSALHFKDYVEKEEQDGDLCTNFPFVLYITILKEKIMLT